MPIVKAIYATMMAHMYASIPVRNAETQPTTPAGMCTSSHYNTLARTCVPARPRLREASAFRPRCRAGFSKVSQLSVLYIEPDRSLSTAAPVPATRVTSNSVGTTLKTMEDRMKVIPRVPLSMTRFSAPVSLARWKRRSRWCRCSNTSLATLRTVPCATCNYMYSS